VTSIRKTSYVSCCPGFRSARLCFMAKHLFKCGVLLHKPYNRCCEGH